VGQLGGDNFETLKQYPWLFPHRSERLAIWQRAYRSTTAQPSLCGPYCGQPFRYCGV